MSIIDLAKAMAPGIPHRIVGIRPGEKLHEVMITEDDARFTVEMADRYVVQPALAWWSYKGYDDKGKPVAEDFRYASDSNPDWLDADALKVMLENPTSIHG
jgi:UDP-N-acetylglucosamine 4,6-dehydratase